MKAFIIGLFSFVCLSCLYADDDQVNAKEVPAYTAALPLGQGRRRIQLLVFSDHTGTDLGDDGSEYRTQELESLQLELGVDNELIKEFTRVNTKPSTFSNEVLSAFKVQAVTISPEQSKDLFKNGSMEGWKVFYKRYPRSSGIITLSRVAFNATGDTALIYVGWNGGFLAGGGFYYVLHRSGRHWKKIKETSTWMS